MSKNIINVPVCPKCNTETQSSYNKRYCYECHEYSQLAPREKKIVSGDYIIADYKSTKTNAEIILTEETTGEKINISLNNFFELIQGLKFGDLKLREKKQGSAYSWEIIKEEK